MCDINRVVKVCEFCGTTLGVSYSNKASQYLCGKHKQQFSKYGKCLKRTSKDKNIIRIYEYYAEIILEDAHCNPTEVCIVSLDKLNIIKNYKWRLSSGYAVTNIKNKTIGIHRIIMGNPEGYIIDHINRNPLDNRNDNLRICTQSNNLMNKGIQSNNTSGYTGIYFDKSRNKWAVEIMVNKKKVFRTRCNTLDEAIVTRKEAEAKYFGEYAPTNS